MRVYFANLEIKKTMVPRSLIADEIFISLFSYMAYFISLIPLSKQLTP